MKDECTFNTLTYMKIKLRNKVYINLMYVVACVNNRFSCYNPRVSIIVFSSVASIFY